MTAVDFIVYGVPAPQGSKTRMPNGAMLDGKSPAARARHKAWRTAVTEAARDAWGDRAPMDGPVCLDVTFRFPMPASRPKAARERGWAPHTVKPDIDKVLRSTLDGLTDAGLIRDDARVFRVSVIAHEVIGWTGAAVQVRPGEVTA